MHSQETCLEEENKRGNKMAYIHNFSSATATSNRFGALTGYKKILQDIKTANNMTSSADAVPLIAKYNGEWIYIEHVNGLNPRKAFDFRYITRYNENINNIHDTNLTAPKAEEVAAARQTYAAQLQEIQKIRQERIERRTPTGQSTNARLEKNLHRK